MDLFLTIFAIILLVSFAYAGLRGAPWVPTKRIDVERFLNLAAIREGDKMYDLGCGDGRMVRAAAEAGAQAEGFELSLFPYILAKVRRSFSTQRSRIKISFRDIWYTDLHDVDIVYFFLMPKFYPKLKDKLEKELKSGARVIAYVWPIEGWEPVKIDEAAGRPKMFLYRKS